MDVMEDEQIFLYEYNAHERMAYYNSIQNNQRYEFLLKELMTQLSVFKFDEYFILNHLSRIENLTEKNQYCLLLGFWILEDNEKISKKKFLQAKKYIVSNIETIKPEDLIRYAKLWLRILTK
jgi:hypothetical protein